MRDLHIVVIHDVGEVIRRKPIGLHDDKIVLAIGLLVRVVHEVGHRDALFGGYEPDRVRLAVRRAPVGLGALDALARPRVVRGAAAGGGLRDVELEVLPGAETPERMAALEQLVRMLPVEVEAQGLAARVSSRAPESPVVRALPGASLLTCLYGPNSPPLSGPANVKHERLACLVWPAGARAAYLRPSADRPTAGHHTDAAPSLRQNVPAHRARQPLTHSCLSLNPRRRSPGPYPPAG